MQLAFDTAKSLLASAVPLHYPHLSAKLSKAAEASDRHLGAVLQQQTQGSWQPWAFFSKKTFIDINALFYFWQRTPCSFFCRQTFSFFLEGHPFTLLTDHKPLISAISKAHFFSAPTASTVLPFRIHHNFCPPTWSPKCGGRHAVTGHLSHPPPKHLQQPQFHLLCPLICFLCLFLTLT